MWCLEQKRGLRKHEHMFKDGIFIAAEIVRRQQIPVYLLIDYDHKAIEGTLKNLEKLIPIGTGSTKLRSSLQNQKEETTASDLAWIVPEILTVGQSSWIEGG